jgi:S-adenosylmethionine hydrolase
MDHYDDNFEKTSFEIEWKVKILEISSFGPFLSSLSKKSWEIVEISKNKQLKKHTSSLKIKLLDTFQICKISEFILKSFWKKK